MKIKLKIPFTKEELLSVLDIEDNALDFKKAEYVCTDSRICNKGDLFIALRGERYNGADFCLDAIEKGAFVVTDTPCEGAFTVNDTHTTLLKLAKAYKKKLTNLKYTVAVTGSVGKSTTKEFLREILKTKYIVHATEGNYNNHIGVPITVLTADTDTEILIIEMGMNSEGEIKELSSFTNPDIAIITNVGTAHIGRLGSREAIAKAKLEILLGMNENGILITPYGEKLLDGFSSVRVGVGCELADVNVRKILDSEDDFSVCAFGKNFDISFRHPGEHLIKNLAFAIGTALLLNLDENDIKCGISHISNNNIRQKIIKYPFFSLIDDTYNASLESVIAAFKLLCKEGCATRSALLSDILELGAYAEDIHFKVGQSAAKYGVDKLYLFGKFSEQIKLGAISSGMREDSIVIKADEESLSDFVWRVLENIKKGETVLSKASHNTEMAAVLKMIDERCK